MEIITGFTGAKHVRSEQDRDINIGTFGEESYVLQTGMKMEAEVSSNNEIKIRDGVIMHQGCAASIKKNTYDSVTIVNGSQGMKRIDLIVARYQRNQDDGKEFMRFVAIQGTPAESNPAVPSHITGDIQSGDAVADMPMYKIIIDGLNITEVQKVFSEAPNIAELNRKLVQTETGKFILPNGLKIFWGKGKTPNTTDPAAVYSAYVIFPETFSNGDYFFTCTEFIGTGEAQKWDKVFNYYSHSNSGTYVGCTYPGKTFYWLAIGY